MDMEKHDFQMEMFMKENGKKGCTMGQGFCIMPLKTKKLKEHLRMEKLMEKLLLLLKNIVFMGI